jgi:NAD(P)-dependent dehydrogenase (short-subunit alcohol dehydrogenase family)
MESAPLTVFGKMVIVTGGSRGMGGAVAELCVRSGVLDGSVCSRGRPRSITCRWADDLFNPSAAPVMS